MMSQAAAEKWRETALVYVEWWLRSEGAETNDDGQWILPRLEEHDGCVYTLHEVIDILDGTDTNLVREARGLEVTQDVLHQVHVERGIVERIPRGEYPVVELDLREDQYIVSLQFSPRMYDNPERKTVDWPWTATIATPLR